MTSVLVGLRFFVFGLFIICNTVLCSVGVWNLSLVETRSFYNAQISAYMIFLGAFGLVFIFPIIFLDLLRRHAFTSRVWVELVWVTVFWVMELSGAAALSAIVPSNHCQPRRGRVAANACTSGQVLLAFAWAITLTLLGYLIMLAIYAIVHHVTDTNVWNETVREYPWFATRSTLSSSPPSPTAEKGTQAPSLKHPRPWTTFNPSEINRETSPFDDPVQPVPTFERVPEPSYQPAQRIYDGLHSATMLDPPPIIEPTFARPREAPRPPVRVQSLYPEHMGAQLSTDARINLYNQSIQLEGQEPSPLRDWPRSSRSVANGRGRKQPPPLDTDLTVLTQPLSAISPNQRWGLYGTTNTASPTSYRLESPVRGPQSSNPARKQPPPPLNLEGISNTSRYGRR